jgi:hypothetical protein
VAGGAVCVLLTRFGSAAWRAAWFGAAGAIAFAFTAALIKAVNGLITAGWSHVFVSWPVYAMAASGLAGLFLAQNAFQAGPVTASQATLVIVDPLASIAIGIGLFGDHIQTGGGRGVGEAIALIVMFAGVFSLSRSPLVISVKAEGEEDVHMLGAQQRGFAVGRRSADESGSRSVTTAGTGALDATRADPPRDLGEEPTAFRECR